MATAGSRQLQAERAGDPGRGSGQQRLAGSWSCSSYSRGKHLTAVASSPWAARKGRSFLGGPGKRQGWHLSGPTELPGEGGQWQTPTEHPEEVGAATASRTFTIGNITAHCGWFGGDRNVTLPPRSGPSIQPGRAPGVLPPRCSGCRTHSFHFMSVFRQDGYGESLERLCAASSAAPLGCWFEFLRDQLLKRDLTAAGLTHRECQLPRDEEALRNHVQAALQELRLRALLESRGRRILRKCPRQSSGWAEHSLQHKGLVGEGGLRPMQCMWSVLVMCFLMPRRTPQLVAECRPWMPPWLMGFPVTHNWTQMSCEDRMGTVRVMASAGAAPLERIFPRPQPPLPQLNAKQLTGSAPWAQTHTVPVASWAPHQHCWSSPATPACGCRCWLSRTSPTPQY